jgi:hypothetical protein
LVQQISISICAPRFMGSDRNAKLGRFTLDRMIMILGRLDENLEVSIDVRPRAAHHDVPV